jgi:membrane-associated phospholipid phosphatase
MTKRRGRPVKRNRFFFITSIASLACFVPLAWWAHRHPQPAGDVAITHTVQRPQSSFLKSVVLVGNTLTGSAVVLNLLVIPVAFVFWKRHLQRKALMTVGISWTSTLVRTIIKKIVDRPRPQPEQVQVMSRSRGTSFPSGHVSSTVDFWGWLLALQVLHMKGTPSWKQKLWMGFSGLCIILVGPSRIYLGEHWSTDVLGGYLFGAGWLGLGIHLYLWMLEGDKRV